MSTMSQGYGVYSCRFVCTERTIYASEYAWLTTLPVQMNKKWQSPEVWPIADRQPTLHQMVSLGSRTEQETEPWQILVGDCNTATWKLASVSCAEAQELQKNMILLFSKGK